MHAWLLSSPGSPEAFQKIERPDPVAEPGWVVIKVDSFGLNRSEFFSRKGLSSPDFSFPRVLGLECTGRVVDPSDSSFTEGERVIALMGGMGRVFDGSYATHTLVPRSQVFSASTQLSPTELGAFPETYNTAYGVCIENLKLKGSQSVLVRGATSALGMAAAAIAKDLGCRVVGSTRSPAKAEILKERGPVDDVILDGDDFSARLLAKAGPMDAVVECVGSKASIESSCATMPDGGRLALVGQLSETWDIDAPLKLPDNVTSDFTRSDLVTSPDDDERMSSILWMAGSRRWTPNIHQIFSFDELPEAHRVMESNQAIGKLVVVVE